MVRGNEMPGEAASNATGAAFNPAALSAPRPLVAGENHAFFLAGFENIYETGPSHSGKKVVYVNISGSWNGIIGTCILDLVIDHASFQPDVRDDEIGRPCNSRPDSHG